MKNTDVARALAECGDELDRIQAIIGMSGAAGSYAPYLTRYALIRACGAVEQGFKSIIFDRCSYRSNQQVKRYLGLKVRESSMNPSYDRICRTVKEFDETWAKRFKAGLKGRSDNKQIQDSLQSLIDARNEFAHGGHPSASIGDVIRYFRSSSKVIEVLDSTVSK